MIHENSSNKTVWIFSGIALLLLAGLLLVSVYWLSRADLGLRNAATALPQAQEVKVNSLIKSDDAIKPPVETFDPVIGPDDAPITIMYFADFACPYCNDMSSVWKQVQSEYGDMVRFVWKDLMLYESSLSLHKASRCAQLQGAFWPYYDQLWGLDVLEGRSVSLINIAQNLGLDTEAFTQCLADTDIEQVVFSVSRQSVSAGITDAPAYFINDEFYDGYRPYEEIEEILIDELNDF